MRTITSNIRRLVAQAQRKSLGSYKVATVQAADYLIQLNLKQLSKNKKPEKDQDPKEFYSKLREEAKLGPLFTKEIIEKIHNIVINLNKDEVKWLATTFLKSNPDLKDLQSIIDWSRATNTSLSNQSFNDVAGKSEDWHKNLHGNVENSGKYKTKNVVFKLPDGFTIVKVEDPEDLQLEGELMQHCVGGYCEEVKRGVSKIFSLRDSKNNPHATIELNNENKVTQIQGKQNKTPIETYQRYLIVWFLSLNNTSWLDIVSDWKIKDEYAELIEDALMRDPQHAYTLSLEEGPNQNYEDAIINSGSAEYIFSYAKDHAYDGGANVAKLTEAIVKTNDIQNIYKFAAWIKGANIPLLEDRYLALLANFDGDKADMLIIFARNVENVNIQKFQDSIIKLKDMRAILKFVSLVPDVDIKSLETSFIESEPTAKDLTIFARNVPGANLDIIGEALIKNISSNKPSASSISSLVDFSRLPNAPVEDIHNWIIKENKPYLSKVYNAFQEVSDEEESLNLRVPTIST